MKRTLSPIISYDDFDEAPTKKGDYKPTPTAIVFDKRQVDVPIFRKTFTRWSRIEDDLLRGLVAQFGSTDWILIATEFSVHQIDRTPEECQIRWEKVIGVGLIKGPWSPAEDHVIYACIAEGIEDWTIISCRVAGRTSKQCRDRWNNHLNPALKTSAWTKEEDDLVIEAQCKLGNSWMRISKFLPGRSENAIKNRWNSHLKKKVGVTILRDFRLPSISSSSSSLLLAKVDDASEYNLVPEEERRSVRRRGLNYLSNRNKSFGIPLSTQIIGNSKYAADDDGSMDGETRDAAAGLLRLSSVLTSPPCHFISTSTCSSLQQQQYYNGSELSSLSCMAANDHKAKMSYLPMLNPLQQGLESVKYQSSSSSLSQGPGLLHTNMALTPSYFLLSTTRPKPLPGIDSPAVDGCDTLKQQQHSFFG